VNEKSKQIVLPDGTKIKVTIRIDGPINEESFPILRDAALANMGECLVSFADNIKPKPSK